MLISYKKEKFEFKMCSFGTVKNTNWSQVFLWRLLRSIVPDFSFSGLDSMPLITHQARSDLEPCNKTVTSVTECRGKVSGIGRCPRPTPALKIHKHTALRGRHKYKHRSGECRNTYCNTEMQNPIRPLIIYIGSYLIKTKV